MTGRTRARRFLARRYAKLVGSCVLPVLGAVPDGAIVLFSGIGPQAQTQLDVGVGALAGSTVMLLTIPWILSIIGGRVPIVNGEVRYNQKKNMPPHEDCLTYVFKTGVSTASDPGRIKVMAYWMLATSLSLLIIQASCFYEWGVDDDVVLAKDENLPALVAMLYAVVGFFAYLGYQWRASQGVTDDKDIDLIVQQIKAGKIGMKAVMQPRLAAIAARQGAGGAGYGATGGAAGEPPKLSEEDLKIFTKLLKPFFTKYDTDKSGKIEMVELNRVFSELGEPKSQTELDGIFADIDKDKSGSIELAEFVEGMKNYCFAHEKDWALEASAAAGGEEGAGGDDEDDEEEEDMPEEFKLLSPEEQQRAVLNRSMYMLLVGTTLVLVFSDPLVDCLDEIGTRTGIPDFYIAFVIAPIVTNGSELMASYTFALKKTSSSIVCSFEQLLGAAVMNNTYCLAIFFVLIYAQTLYWPFTAETITILFIEIVMAAVSFKQTQTVFTGILVLSLYPLALVLVAVLGMIGLGR